MSKGPSIVRSFGLTVTLTICLHKEASARPYLPLGSGTILAEREILDRRIWRSACQASARPSRSRFSSWTRCRISNSSQGSMLPALPVRTRNRVICVPGIGSTKPFSVLVADRMPDLHLLAFGQCFPRWAYSRPRGIFDDSDLFPAEPERVDNITDTALRRFPRRVRRQIPSRRMTSSITYTVSFTRRNTGTGLRTTSPRAASHPLRPGFRAFAEAGTALTRLHLQYEDVDCRSIRLECRRRRKAPSSRVTIVWRHGPCALRTSSNVTLYS